MSLIFVICVFFVSNFAFGAIPASERAALIDLYNSTNGASWTNKTNWLGAVGTEGTWYGVTVVNNHVTKINLRNNNLTGTLPASLGYSFPYLQFLYLDYNNIGGDIPDTWGNSPRLLEIYLGNNQLTGIIPDSLRNLPSLRILDISHNQIRGTIPDSLSCLPLQNLVLERNLLTGELPCCIFCMQTLKFLDLSSNGFTGSIPKEIGNLSNLEQLFLDRNLFSGPIPSEIGNLTKLKVLYLNNNQLSGQIPSSIGLLPNLKYLALNTNRLEGQVPASFSNLNSLLVYYIYGNMLMGAMPIMLLPPGANYDYNALNPLLGSDFFKQTLAPAGVAGVRLSPTSIKVSWTPISYQQGNGGYVVYYSTIPNDPSAPSVFVPSKSSSSVVLSGLLPSTPYYIRVKARTDPYWNNQNTVFSQNSSEIHVL